MDKLFDIAKRIPSIGCGGTAIAKQLYEAANTIKDGEAIIETGSWLGSTTGFVMAGLAKRISDSPVDFEYHCYDLWRTYPHIVKQAAKIGLYFRDGQYILTDFIRNIKPFGIDPIIHQGDFYEQSYESNKTIGLVIDDICSKKPMMDHLLEITLPKCRQGTLFYLMDFYFYEDHPGRIRRKYQQDLMNANKNVFSFVDRPMNTRTAIYLYKGGLPELPDRSEYMDDWKDEEGNRIL